MANSDSNDKSKTETLTMKELIKMECGIINELKKMLQDPELTVSEKTKIANVFAFHANTLNRLMSRKGEENQIEDQNLGDYLRGVEPRIYRQVRRDFRQWRRTLSLRR
jgi:hypothetical protein